jgi:hypothetical protein
MDHRNNRVAAPVADGAPARRVRSSNVVRTLDLTNWAGRWVAVDGHGRVRRDADSLSDLVSALAADGIADLEVMRAPSPGDPVVYGLG